MKIIISMSAYNEEESIAKVINDIKETLQSHPYQYLIHVIDDGSTDKTREIAISLGVKCFSNQVNLGLASSFKKEIEYAQDADIFIHTDADNQYPAKYIPQLIEQAQNYDLVLGSRFLNGNRYSNSFFKNIGNQLFTWAVSKIVKHKITDMTTGFRAFNKKIMNLSKIDKFTYTYEQIIRASRDGFKIKEIPITTNKTRKSHLFKNPIEYAWRGGINLLRIFRDYEPLKFFGIIALMFLLPGIIVGSRLTFWYLTKGHIYNRIPSAIVCLMLILLGVQVFLFGFLADGFKNAQKI